MRENANAARLAVNIVPAVISDAVIEAVEPPVEDVALVAARVR